MPSKSFALFFCRPLRWSKNFFYLAKKLKWKKNCKKNWKKDELNLIHHSLLTFGEKKDKRMLCIVCIQYEIWVQKVYTKKCTHIRYQESIFRILELFFSSSKFWKFKITMKSAETCTVYTFKEIKQRENKVIYLFRTD